MNMSIDNIFLLFEQLTLAVACSASWRLGSREVSISESNVTFRKVKVDRYCLPATTIHAISHMTFPAFYFSIVSYMRLLFQLQGQYCFSLKTKLPIIRAFIWKEALGAVHLNSLPCSVAFRDRYFWLAGQHRAEETSAKVTCPKSLILVNSVYTKNVASVHV